LSDDSNKAHDELNDISGRSGYLNDDEYQNAFDSRKKNTASGPDILQTLMTKFNEKNKGRYFDAKKSFGGLGSQYSRSKEIDPTLIFVQISKDEFDEDDDRDIIESKTIDNGIEALSIKPYEFFSALSKWSDMVDIYNETMQEYNSRNIISQAFELGDSFFDENLYVVARTKGLPVKYVVLFRPIQDDENGLLPPSWYLTKSDIQPNSGSNRGVNNATSGLGMSPGRLASEAEYYIPPGERRDTYGAMDNTGAVEYGGSKPQTRKRRVIRSRYTQKRP